MHAPSPIPQAYLRGAGGRKATAPKAPQGPGSEQSERYLSLDKYEGSCSYFAGVSADHTRRTSNKNRSSEVIILGVKVGIPIMKLNNHRTRSKRKGYMRAVFCEGLCERWGTDPDIDRSRTPTNEYTGDYRSGQALTAAITAEAEAYSQRQREQGKRGLRSDAVIGWAAIVKPPAEWINTLSPEQRKKFFDDSRVIMYDFMGCDEKGRSNIRATVLHHDETGDHEHFYGTAKTSDGRFCAKDLINLKLFQKFNREYPRRMREMGWEVDDCTVYDPEKVAKMDKDQAQEYKQECIRKKKSRKTGQDSKAYKASKEIEKLEKEKDKARLGRDLALAATQQARQQTAATLQQKAALETDIAVLLAQADSYPTDLQDRLDALSAAAKEYHAATIKDEGGPLIHFLQHIKVNQRKKDGSTVKLSVYDLWQEYPFGFLYFIRRRWKIMGVSGGAGCSSVSINPPANQVRKREVDWNRPLCYNYRV